MTDYVEISIIIKGSLKEIYKLSKDMEKFPEFMPDVKKIEIIERGENWTITSWDSMLEDAPISWRELEEFDEENFHIKYKLLEGDLDKFEGEWIFKKTDEGVKITLTVNYDFGIPALEKIIGPILKIKVEENAKMMLEAIKRKIEMGEN